MDSFISARDAASNTSSRDPRRRSVSPPARRPRIDDPRRPSRDHDAPAIPLQRRPEFANLPDRPASGRQPSDQRNGSTSISNQTDEATTAADLLRHLQTFPTLKAQFKDLEKKRFVISENRKEHKETEKKLRGHQDYLAKNPAKAADWQGRLNALQDDQAQLQSRIESMENELFSADLEHRASFQQRVASLVIQPARAHADEAIAKVREELANLKAENSKLKDWVRVFGSDISSLKKDTANAVADHERIKAIEVDFDTFKERAKRDLEKDLQKLQNHLERIRSLEKQADTVQSTLRELASSQSRTTDRNYNASVQASSVIPDGPPGQPSRSGQDPRDQPRSHPPPPPSASSSDPSAAPGSLSRAEDPSSSLKSLDAVSALVASTDNRLGALERSSLARQEKFTQWIKDFEANLDARMEEWKDVAVLEATSENQACMHDLLRGMVRRHRDRMIHERGGGDGHKSSSATLVDSSNGDKSGTVAPASLPPGTTTDDGSGSAAKSLAASVATEAALATANERAGSAPLPADSNSASSTSPLVNSANKVNGASASDDQLNALKVMVQSQVAALHRENEELKKQVQDPISLLLSSPESLQRLSAVLKRFEAASTNGATVDTGAAVASGRTERLNEEVQTLRQNAADKDRRIEVLENRLQELTQMLQETSNDFKSKWEAIDDQSSVQAALLIKIAEHANPRRRTNSSSAALNAPALPQPLQSAQQQIVQSPHLAQPAQHSPSLNSARAVHGPAHHPMTYNAPSVLSSAQMHPSPQLSSNSAQQTRYQSMAPPPQQHRQMQPQQQPHHPQQFQQHPSSQPQPQSQSHPHQQHMQYGQSPYPPL